MFALFTGGGGVNWTSADIRCLLVDTDYVFDPDDNFVTDLVADELSTTNYARQAVGSRTITEDDAGNRVAFDAADVVFASLGPAVGGPVIGGAVLFVHTGDDATATLIAFVDLNLQTNGSNVTIQWDADGIFEATSP
jgi:hypothetical protein